MADNIKEKLLKESIDAAKASENGAEYADREDEVIEEENVSADTKDPDKAEAHDEIDESPEEQEAVKDSEEQDKEDDKGSDEGKAKAKDKKGFFGKKDKKDKRDEQIKDLNDRLLRNLAEFDNFRKRTEREKAQMFEIGAKSIIEKILPTIDNFERAITSVPEELKGNAYCEGVDKIYKQLMSNLEEAGVKPIEALGAKFDPNLHNAVMHEENEEFGEDTVSAELQKGYTYHDSVIRHSMVKVAN
ncbi:MAG: nucleotide exchange factor GrpE [Lachnospiraceae bacterium]|nr:nucleotide exchange factor GrpE [Lachnospiraceae bacterium]